ncbi:helix-turn-helix domain-containing protein [Serratia marcescens]|uniref:helix-turn-helix domain-containing protein n=1 Tax=Serratia marcescens TaxID=615 RepID=UPI0034E87223
MNTFRCCINQLAKERGITIKQIAQRIGVSRSTAVRMMNSDALSQSGRQMFAIAVGVTLKDINEICRMIDEMEGDFKKGDNHGH